MPGVCDPDIDSSDVEFLGNTWPNCAGAVIWSEVRKKWVRADAVTFILAYNVNYH